jgi:hypothetical protein
MRPINRTVLRETYAHMVGRVTYEMGAKAPSLTCDSADIAQIDCSGLARYLVAKASGQAVIMPDGSAAQLQWCIDSGLERESYQPGATAQDNVLRIHFLTAERAAMVGRPGDRHVWFTFNGRTIESHGGGGCVPRLPLIWILEQSDYSFVVPSIP